jgi:hypothetical protein
MDLKGASTFVSDKPIMAAQGRASGVVRGLTGALFGLFACFVFSFGLSLRACLPDRPELLWVVTFEFWIIGFIVYIPATIAGFLIGYFVRLKTFFILALVFAVVAFGVGYAVARDGCLPL